MSRPPVTGTCDLPNFACTSGECLSSDARCDGVVQCKDQTDEKNCSELSSYTRPILPPSLSLAVYIYFNILFKLFSFWRMTWHVYVAGRSTTWHGVTRAPDAVVLLTLCIMCWRAVEVFDDILFLFVDGGAHAVCADGFTKQHADLACQYLRYP